MDKNPKNKQKRPKIPIRTQLKLWVSAGGRCEFPGCNKQVWRDGLTFREDNYSHIAHIISWTPTGPRGDAKLSVKLGKDFDNLMLMCLEHSKLIDGRHKGDFSVGTLRSFKVEHEGRIRLQTSLSDNMKSTLVIFKANIGERPMNIAIPQVYRAIQPRYPEEKEILLDFTDHAGEGTKTYWSTTAKEIKRRFNGQFRRSSNQPLPNHLSIFALGPIPFLVYLGNVIGNITPSDLFQKHRDSDDWTWKPSAKTNQVKYLISKPKHPSGKDVALVISISGAVQKDSVLKLVSKNTPMYQISVSSPGVNVLNTMNNLNDFRRVYRSLMDEIRTAHGHDATVHFFAAVPAPIAVACGLDLLPKVDPHLLVYDYSHQNGGYISTLKIN